MNIPVNLNEAKVDDVYYHERLFLYYKAIFISPEGVLFKRIDEVGDEQGETYCQKDSGIKLVHTIGDIDFKHNKLKEIKKTIESELTHCEYQIKEKLKNRRKLKNYRDAVINEIENSKSNK